MHRNACGCGITYLIIPYLNGTFIRVKFHKKGIKRTDILR